MASSGPQSRDAQQTVSAEIYRKLREEIVTLKRPPGSSLSDKELSARFQVSRTPVREALMKLAEEEMVSIIPYSGTFVTKVHAETLRNSQFVRVALECTSIEDAPTNMTASGLSTLRTIIRKQEAEIGKADRSSFYQLDEAFHQQLFEMAGHGDAWPIVNRVKAQLDRARYLAITHESRLYEVVAEHRRIADALEKRDSTASREALLAHLTAAFESIERAITAYRSYFAHPEDNSLASSGSRNRRRGNGQR
nr:GntR family transcriptional regulator [Halomonas socia]